MYVFEMTADVALEFFRRVQLLDVDNEQNREAILFKMGEEGLLKRISATNRTKEDYIKAVSKEFKVLDMTENNNAD